MGTHWNEVQQLVEALGYVGNEVRSNGFDLMFVSDSQIRTAFSTTGLLECLQSQSRILANNRQTAVMSALATASENYAGGSNSSGSRRTKESIRECFSRTLPDNNGPKPCILLVLTDAAWVLPGIYTAAGPVRRFADQVLGATPTQVRVSFIQFGTDAARAEDLLEFVYRCNWNEIDNTARVASRLDASGSMMDMLLGPSDPAAFGETIERRSDNSSIGTHGPGTRKSSTPKSDTDKSERIRPGARIGLEMGRQGLYDETQRTPPLPKRA